MSLESARIEPWQVGLGRLFPRVRDAVVVGNASTGKIELWNPGAERLFGYTQLEAVGMLVEELVPERLRDAHRAGIARFAESGAGPLVDAEATVELPARTKDNVEIEVELTLTPLAVVEGTRFVMAIIRDISERKHVEAQLREALTLQRELTAHLQEVDELRKFFVTMAAHDVRSPLTSVLGFAKILRDRWETLSGEARNEMLDAIVRSGHAANQLAEDILDVAALESGRIQYDLETVDVGALITETMTNMRAAHPDVKFEVEVLDELHVHADRRRVWQILTNLITNAVKFTPPGEAVRVGARRVGGSVEVMVADRGPGIAEADQAQLFQRFARPGSNKPLRGMTGAGLGLHLCKLLVEAQGGRICVESAEGAGTVFTFDLPAIA